MTRISDESTKKLPIVREEKVALHTDDSAADDIANFHRMGRFDQTLVADYLAV